MPTHPWLSGAALGLFAAGCGNVSPDIPRLDDTSELSSKLAEEDSDPLAHVRFLSTDAMRGRNSPSVELDQAADYVRERLVRYGLQGPNPGDELGPYVQSFTLQRFTAAAPELSLGERSEHEHLDFGHELFSGGFYQSPWMSQSAQEALAVQAQRYLGRAPQNVAEGLAASPGVAAGDKVRNVLGLLPGTGPNKDQVVVLMAHLDHIGASFRGINNGADDNASGSGTLLSLVPALAAASADGKLDRSVLFFWTGAEEKGLVGAQYFVDHSPAQVPLANVVAVVNMDMVGRWTADRLSIIDTDEAGTINPIRAHFDAANAALPTPFARVNRDIDQYRKRQDGSVFLTKGKDVFFVFEGLSNPQGGGNLIAEYHRPTDDIERIISDNGGDKMRKLRDLLVDLAKRVAGTNSQPTPEPEPGPIPDPGPVPF